MRNRAAQKIESCMLEFGWIMVLMKSDVVNFCQHFALSQDSRKPFLPETSEEGRTVEVRAGTRFSWS